MCAHEPLVRHSEFDAAYTNRSFASESFASRGLGADMQLLSQPSLQSVLGAVAGYGRWMYYFRLIWQLNRRQNENSVGSASNGHRIESTRCAAWTREEQKEGM
jgi:hypothetical protein